MKGQLRMHGWPLQGGRYLIPEGTIIDTDAGTDQWSRLVVSLGITTPPINMQPLDQTTYNTMKAIYQPLQFDRWIITVPGADGIVR